MRSLPAHAVHRCVPRAVWLLPLLIAAGCAPRPVAPVERLVQIMSPDVGVALIAPEAGQVYDGLALLAGLQAWDARSSDEGAAESTVFSDALSLGEVAAEALTLAAADPALPVAIYLDTTPPGRAALALGYRDAALIERALRAGLADRWAEVHVHDFPADRILLVGSSEELMRRMAIRADACPERAKAPGGDAGSGEWIVMVRPARAADLWRSRQARWLALLDEPGTGPDPSAEDDGFWLELGVDQADLHAWGVRLSEALVHAQPIYGVFRVSETGYDLTLRWDAASHPGLRALLGPPPDAPLQPLAAEGASFAAALPLHPALRTLLLRGVQDWALGTGDPVTVEAVGPLDALLGDAIAFAALGDASGVVCVSVRDAARASALLREVLPPPQFADAGVAWTSVGEYPVGYAVDDGRMLLAFGPGSREVAADAARGGTEAGRGLRWRVEAGPGAAAWFREQVGVALPEAAIDRIGSVAVSSAVDGPDETLQVRVRLRTTHARDGAREERSSDVR